MCYFIVWEERKKNIVKTFNWFCMNSKITKDKFARDEII